MTLPMTSPTALIARDLVCERGGREVFRGVSFDVVAGTLLTLTGANGAGKSSLLRQIAGLLPLAAGEVMLHGGARDAPLGEQVHYVGHLDAVKPYFSVLENMRFWAALAGGIEDVARDIGVALSALALDNLADVPAAYLSAGQRRRLSLARLGLGSRPLWLLDEPTVSLDEESVDRLTAVIRAHLGRGGMAVVASHVPLSVEGAILRLGTGDRMPAS